MRRAVRVPLLAPWMANWRIAEIGCQRGVLCCPAYASLPTTAGMILAETGLEPLVKPTATLRTACWLGLVNFGSMQYLKFGIGYLRGGWWRPRPARKLDLDDGDSSTPPYEVGLAVCCLWRCQVSQVEETEGSCLLFMAVAARCGAPKRRVKVATLIWSQFRYPV